VPKSTSRAIDQWTRPLEMPSYLPNRARIRVLLANRTTHWWMVRIIWQTLVFAIGLQQYSWIPCKHVISNWHESAEYDPGDNCDPNGYNPSDPMGLDNWEGQLAKKKAANWFGILSQKAEAEWLQMVVWLGRELVGSIWTIYTGGWWVITSAPSSFVTYFCTLEDKLSF